MKPKAAIIDLDDTTVGFVSFLCDWKNKADKTNFSIEDVKSWELPPELDVVFKRFENVGLYGMLTPLPGAKQAIDYLHLVLGYKIIFLTARDPKFGEITFANLVHHKIHFDELLFEKNKVKKIRELGKKYHLSMFADDKLETVEMVAEKCRIDNVFLVSMPHNRKEDLDPDIQRVRDLLDCLRILE